MRIKAEEKATAVVENDGVTDRDADVSGIQAPRGELNVPPAGDANAKHKGKAGFSRRERGARRDGGAEIETASG